MKQILYSQRVTLILPALDFPQVKNLFWLDNKSFIDHACSVKVAEYWSPFCVFMDLRSIIIEPSWPHVWSITLINFLLYRARELKEIQRQRGT